MDKKDIIKKYLENGVGFNCNTKELKDLQLFFSKSEDLLLKNLECLENRKNELYNAKVEETALDRVKIELMKEELDNIRNSINLIIIALRFNSVDEFIKDRLD